MSNKKTLVVTVFIHGTLCSEFFFLDPLNIYHGSVDNTSYYIKFLRSVRNNPLLFIDQAIMEEGLHALDPTLITAIQNNTEASRAASSYAAYFIIAAYDLIAQSTNSSLQCDRHYYTFGHMGALSQAYREQAADDLYHALCGLRTSYSNEYTSISFVLEAHSHGGNIVLQLHKKEMLYHCGLFITAAIFWGTPIQEETILSVYSSLFGKLFNCYAQHDIIQTLDFFSTASRKSYKTLHNSPYGLEKKSSFYDVLLILNNNIRAAGHMNMWFLTHAYPRLPLLDPLPCVVLSPIIQYLVPLTCSNSTTFSTQVTDPDRIITCSSTALQNVDIAVKTEAEPYHLSLLFLAPVHEALRSWWAYYHVSFYRLWSAREAFFMRHISRLILSRQLSTKEDKKSHKL